MRIITSDDVEYLFGHESVKIGTIDALTMSYSDTRDWDVSRSLYYCIETLQKRGFLTRPWYGNGYRGWRIGSLRFGISQKYPEKSLMMISGDLTAMVAHEVERKGKCTRVDFAYDVMMAKSDKVVRDVYMDWFDSYDKSSNQRDNRNLYKSRNGGFTVTRGTRGRGIFIRVYDKGAEQNMGRDWWIRFEVEVKNPWATSALQKWYDAENKTAYCTSLVDLFMSKRGMPSLIDLGVKTTAVELSRIVAKDEDLERKMVFLEKTVKPFLHRMKNYVTVEEILNILDL